MTENPRVENSVITPVNMHPEGSDLNGALFMLDVLEVRSYSCLFDKFTALHPIIHLIDFNLRFYI